MYGWMDNKFTHRDNVIDVILIGVQEVIDASAESVKGITFASANSVMTQLVGWERSSGWLRDPSLSRGSSKARLH